jgi:LPPG:FO 2-phospho-L-lactate transferase
MRIVLLTDGSGAGLAHDLAEQLENADTLDVVAPVTRDMWANGLKCCPDLDAFLTVPRTAAPTFAVADALAAVGFSPSWMRPSDRSIAVQIVRTELLQAGYTLTDATTAMSARASLPFRLLPVSDDRAELHVVVDEPDGRRALHVEEYLAGPRPPQAVGITIVTRSWAGSASVGVVLDTADAVVLGPSSPVAALGPLLAAPGLRDHLTAPVLEVERDATEPTGLDDLAALAPPSLPPATRVQNDATDVLAAARDAVRVGR